MLKKHALIIAITYTLLITILSFISLNSVPDLGFDYQDKIAHSLIYMVFTFFWFNFFRQIQLPKALITAILFAVKYGIVIEVLQGSLTDSRQFDYYDIVANIIGALLIVPFLKLNERYVKK